MTPAFLKGLLVLVCLSFVSAMSAQAPVRCSGPLSEEQLADLIGSHVPEARVELYVRTCGISFQVTGAAAARLRAAGAPAALISLLEERAPKNVPAIEEFTASPRTVLEGAEVELRWRVKNADSVELQPGIGRVPAEGSQRVVPQSTTAYRLAAAGAGGPKTAEVTVEVAKRPRIVKFEANPARIHTGEETLLSWQIENADSVEITGGVGQVSATGSRAVKPVSSRSYTVTARRLGVEVKGTATVQVLGPALAGVGKIQFVRIPAGEFLMGSENGDTDEKPVHRVRITKAFEIGQYEVTQAQWGKVMGSSPSYFKGADRPIESVSWEDVQGFLRALNGANDGYRYRLPTESEWEYAARAGSTADVADLDSAAWHQGNAGNETHPVGTKRPNAWELYDMLGNVWEWCQDLYDGDYYRTSPETDPQGPLSGPVDSKRVVRGGAWFGPPNTLRAADRARAASGDWSFRVGFRLVREPGPATGASGPPDGSETVTNRIPSLNADVLGLRFYDSGREHVALKDRTYLARFRSADTRYINWEVELKYPVRDAPETVAFVAVWYRPDGSVETRQSGTFNPQAGWSHSRHGKGWGSEKGGSFAAGRYWVEVLVEGQRVARAAFDVY